MAVIELDPFTRAFRALATERKLKTADIALAASTDAAYVYRLYMGQKRNPTPQMCERLAYGLVRGDLSNYDEFVGIADMLLVAAGYQGLSVQRRRVRS